MVLSSRKETSRDYIPSDGVKRLVSAFFLLSFFFFLRDTSHDTAYVFFYLSHSSPLSKIDR
jgi:hypothetical protein